MCGQGRLSRKEMGFSPCKNGKGARSEKSYQILLVGST
jgi:hypothetical protein